MIDCLTLRKCDDWKLFGKMAEEFKESGEWIVPELSRYILSVTAEVFNLVNALLRCL